MRARIASLGVAIGLALATALAADDASGLRGTWAVNNWIPGDEVHLVLKLGTATSRWTWGSTHPLADLKGLTREQLRAGRAEVSFTVERDAGVFFMTGTSTLGFASGEFRFV